MSGQASRLWRVHPLLNENKARHARLSAALLFVLLVSDALGLALTLQPGFMDSPSFWITLGLLPVLGAGFLLTRTQHFQLGALLACIALVAAVWLLHALRPDPSEAEALLHYLVLPILAANLLLPLRWAVLVLVSIVVLAMVPLEPLVGARHAHEAGADLGVVVYLGIVSAAALIFGIVNNRNQDLLEKQTQETRQAYEAVKQADAQRVRMLHQIAHDINTPLTPIQLQLTVLREKAPEHLRRIDIMERNAQQVGRLVSDISDLARVEGGTLRLALEDTCLDELATSAVESLAPVAAQRGIQIKIDAARVPVRVDSGRVKQVLFNLIGNAIKFTPNSGSVHVAVSSLHGWAHVAVKDTGLGMNPQQVEALFRPFSQVHAEHAHKGTGLGLFIAKGLIEAHGGNIQATSPGNGQGSTFTFQLPSTRDAPAPSRL